jgi:hypothetical protein
MPIASSFTFHSHRFGPDSCFSTSCMQRTLRQATCWDLRLVTAHRPARVLGTYCAFGFLIEHHSISSLRLKMRIRFLTYDLNIGTRLRIASGGSPELLCRAIARFLST